MNTTDDNSKYDKQILIGLDLSLMFQIEDFKTGYIYKDENGNTIKAEEIIEINRPKTEEGEPQTEEKKPPIIKEKIPIQIPYPRYPQTDEDFNLIFDREFNKHPELNDRSIFKELQVKVIGRILKKYEDSNPEGMDPELYEIACKYVDYLKPNEDRIKKWKKDIPIKDFGLKRSVPESHVRKYYYWLLKKKLIHCTDEHFLAVFSNAPLPSDWEPIVWNGNASQLAAIITDLLEVPKSEPSRKKMSQFFIDKKGKPIRPAIRLSAKNLGQYSPRKEDL